MDPIFPPGTPQELAYTPAYKLNKTTDLIFLGLITPKRNGTINPSILQQTHDCFLNLSDILQPLGPNAKVIKVTRLMTDASEIWNSHPEFIRYFGDALPTSTLIQVPSCSEPEARIELEVWAAVPRGEGESLEPRVRSMGPDGAPLAVSVHSHASLGFAKGSSGNAAGQGVVTELNAALDAIDQRVSEARGSFVKFALLLTDMRSWKACREVVVNRYKGQTLVIVPIAVPNVQQQGASIEVEGTFVASTEANDTAEAGSPRRGDLLAASGQPAIPVFVGGMALDTYKFKPYSSVAAQTKMALENIETILKASGCNWNDVIKTRWYITDIKEWPQIEEAALAIFGRPLPSPTVVEVSALVKQGIRVEPDIWANVMRPNH
ncbi:hypothetical protein PHISCL_02098 [Aspergillus sclerotialis]|uniref:Uncharacterized protein n=1 Tax=Aspergillus sclerotialis TaxID=2070753 RepID=A0A3A2ZQX7_9EURO|nr:hypothetical protein PHISCL_02098 [Aspergillus sclerotialis]